jgi:hypothetical protein
MSSPFVKRKIMCPICEKESHQFTLMPNLYSVEEKEEDQHPLKLKWYDPDNQDIKPQYYVLFHCPFCLFTDFEDNFMKPQTIQNFNGLRTNYIKPNPSKSKVLQTLRSKISFQNMDFQSALFIHLLAIYIYELETRDQYKDIKKLARLYHRTAWLYREQQPSNTTGDDDISKKDIQSNLDSLSTSFAEFNKKLLPLIDNLKRRVLDLGIKYDDSNNPYLPPLNEFNALSEQMHKTITKLRIVSTKDKELIQNTAKADDSQNYQEEIAKLTDIWPTVPMNERDCLNKAIENYEKQYQKISSNDSLNQQVGIMNILTELCLRVNNYEKAYEYLSSLYQFCATSRQNLYSQQRQSPSSLVESQLNKLGDVMFGLSEKRKLIEVKQLEYYSPQIVKFTKENSSLAWDEIKEELLKRAIPENVLDRYNDGPLEISDEEDDDETEDISEDGGKKKKRWGIF